MNVQGKAIVVVSVVMALLLCTTFASGIEADHRSDDAIGALKGLNSAHHGVAERTIHFCAEPQIAIAKPDSFFTICLTVDSLADTDDVISVMISLSFDTTLIWFDSIYTFQNSCLDSAGWQFKWLHPGGDYSQLEIWLVGGGTEPGLECEGCLVYIEFLVDASATPGDSTPIAFDEILVNEGEIPAVGCEVLFIVNRPPQFNTIFDDTTYLIEKHEYCVDIEAFDPDGDSLIMWSILDPYPCDGAEPDTAYGRGTVTMEWCWTPPKPGICDTLQDTLVVMSTFETGQPLYDTLTTTIIVYDNLIDIFWPDTVWHACGCFEVPLYIMHNRDYNECLDSLGILSFDLILDYDAELLTVFEVGNEGLITEDWGAMQFNVENGYIYVGMAGNFMLSYCDTTPTPLIYVGFCVNQGTEVGDSALLSVDHVKLNEGWPTVYWWNGSITVIDYSISGTVTYCDVGVPVPGVEMKISHEWPPLTYVDTVYTDTLGYYEVADVQGCTEYCFRPQKHNLPGQVVTSFDASLLLRGIAGMYALSSCDSLAADVSRDGTVSAYDAALMLRSIVCDHCGTDPAPHVGEWIFLPDHRCYDDVDSSYTNQDYVGIIIGDVSKNYPGDGPPRVGMDGIIARVVGKTVSVEFSEPVSGVDLVICHPAGLHVVDISTSGLVEWMTCNGQLRVSAASERPLAPIEITFEEMVTTELEMSALADESRMIRSTFKILPLPAEYRLAQNYPNPFNPATDIRYQIPDSRSSLHTTLKIYNILGQEVRTLVDELQEAGYYTVTWDGRDGNGNGVSSGIYFYRLSAGHFTAMRRMVLIK